MTSAIRTAVIAARSDEVWAVLANFDSISTWADFVDHSSLLTEQTEGVGTTRRIQMGRTTVVETVSAWEPGVTFSYEITGLPPVIKSVTTTWRLGASGDATMVWIVTDVSTGPRPPQLAIAKGVARRLAKSSVQMLQGLNAHLLEEHAE
ncbi:MAG: SRPBCC family protein [Acidimicrobiales bacterium]